MALPADHFTLGLAGLSLEARLLPLDPTKFADYCQAHRVIGHCQGGRHPHPTIGRVNPEVQVLDGLPDNLNHQAVDHDLALLSIHAGSSPVPESLPPAHPLARCSFLCRTPSWAQDWHRFPSCTSQPPF